MMPPDVYQDPQPVLEVRSLAKRFKLHERQRTIQAFEGLSFTAHTHHLAAMVGASGSGKSSALKCIYRTYVSDHGAILYRAQGGRTIDLTTADEQTVLDLRRDEIRFVSQFLKSLPRKTALQVVARPLVEKGIDHNQAMRHAREALERVNLPARLHELPPSTFSGGERQLVNLARALVVRPRLLLLDEPTASLDPRSTDRMVEIIRSLKQEPIAILAVFHDRRIVQSLADSTIEIAGGITWDHATESVLEEAALD
ncbi:MAG: ATP-binding cassette domain-containing protein [Planctomycetota bacterium]